MGIFSYLATELSYVAAVMVQAGTGSPALKVHDVHHWVMSCSPNAYMIWAHFQPLYIYTHTTHHVAPIVPSPRPKPPPLMVVQTFTAFFTLDVIVRIIVLKRKFWKAADVSGEQCLVVCQEW